MLIFSTHIFQPPVGLLMPARERAENRGVCVRENDNKRTEGMLVGSLCWAVKELESESTIQTTLPALHSLSHNNTKAGRKTNTHFWKNNN